MAGEECAEVPSETLIRLVEVEVPRGDWACWGSHRQTSILNWLNRFDALPHIARRHRARRDEYRASGLWRGETLSTVFDRVAEKQPEQVWRFVRVDAGSEHATTLAALASHAGTFAAELGRLAAEPDPVVASVLANVAGAVSTCFGTLTVGGVAFPVSLRETRDSLAALLARVGVSDIVVADEDAERLGWAEGYLAARLVRRIWRTAADGAITVHGAITAAQPSVYRRPREEGVCMVTYTSGSTAEPKIVLCGDDQLLAERAFRDVLVTRGPSLVPSPVGHITGVLNLLVFPLMRPDPVVAMDRWDASVAVDACRRYGCTELRGTSVYAQQMLSGRARPRRLEDRNRRRRPSRSGHG